MPGCGLAGGMKHFNTDDTPLLVTSSTTPGIPLLPSNIRCDQCYIGEAVYRVAVDVVKNLWLDLCAHHFHIHEAEFAAAGYDWEDKSSELK
jgi:hypothetical protein